METAPRIFLFLGTLPSRAGHGKDQSVEMGYQIMAGDNTERFNLSNKYDFLIWKCHCSIEAGGTDANLPQKQLGDRRSGEKILCENKED